MDWTMFAAISAIVMAAIAAGWKIIKTFADKDAEMLESKLSNEKELLEAKLLNKAHQLADIERRITLSELQDVRFETKFEVLRAAAAAANKA